MRFDVSHLRFKLELLVDGFFKKKRGGATQAGSGETMQESPMKASCSLRGDSKRLIGIDGFVEFIPITLVRPVIAAGVLGWTYLILLVRVGGTP